MMKTQKSDIEKINLIKEGKDIDKIIGQNT